MLISKVRWFGICLHVNAKIYSLQFVVYLEKNKLFKALLKLKFRSVTRNRYIAAYHASYVFCSCKFLLLLYIYTLLNILCLDFDS